MMKSLVGIVTVGMLMLTGCAEAPPPDTREADAKTVRELEASMGKDFAAKDVDKLVAVYADDASVSLTNMPIIKGKEAIRGALKAMLVDMMGELQFEVAKVEVSKGGDFAYTQGTYSSKTMDPATKKMMAEKGKYVTVYKKMADGSWKIATDINNPDAPAVPVK